ncbi:MAG: YjgP/YjgQ family permease [bacterium]|nr:YjgP/YjgQ family permease [bacterium]
MFILTRYIIRTLLGPFIFGLAVIIFLFMTNYMIRQMQIFLSKDVPLDVVFQLMILSLAWMMALAVPMAVLLSMIMGFGKLSGDNEIVALKANGVGLHRIMAPLLIVATFLAGGMFLFNEYVVPEVNFKIRTLSIHINKKNPKLVFQPNVFSDERLIRKYSLLFEKIDNSSPWVYGVLIFNRADPREHKTIVADRGTMEFSEAESQIVLTLYDGEVHQVDLETLSEYRLMQFEKQVVRIPFENDEFTMGDNASRGDRSKNIKMMRENIAGWEKMVEGHKKVIVQRIERVLKINRLDDEELKTFLFSMTKESFIRNPEGRGYIIRNDIGHETIDLVNKSLSLVSLLQTDMYRIQSNIKMQNRYLVEIYKKYSLPFACIIFVLIGIPLGVRSRHGGLAVGGSMSVLFYLVYWAFLIGGEKLADRGFLSAWLSMWLPNIVVGSFGIWLTISMIRERTMIDSRWYTVINKITNLLKR